MEWCAIKKIGAQNKPLLYKNNETQPHGMGLHQKDKAQKKPLLEIRSLEIRYEIR